MVLTGRKISAPNSPDVSWKVRRASSRDHRFLEASWLPLEGLEWLTVFREEPSFWQPVEKSHVSSHTKIRASVHISLNSGQRLLSFTSQMTTNLLEQTFFNGDVAPAENGRPAETDTRHFVEETS